MNILKDDIKTVGYLQLCIGQEAGSEGAIHTIFK